MLRVLHVLAKRPIGGVGSMLMSYNELIDHNRIIFDAFICSDDKSNKFDENILRYNGNIYIAPAFSLKKLKEIKSKFINTIKTNKYDIIHIHSVNSGFLFLRAADENGVKCRIMHAHSTKLSDNKLKAARNYILKRIDNKFITHFAACSMAAAIATFGISKVKKSGVNIIRNIIDTERFAFNLKLRVRIRNELCLTDKIVVGLVGRLSSEKNLFFALKIAKRLCSINKNVVFLSVGDGPLKEKIKRKVLRYGISDKFIMLGNRSDVNELLNAMDIFIMPSKFEGFGSSVVEAQLNGLICYASDNVPKETDIGLCNYLPIKNAVDLWVEELLNLLSNETLYCRKQALCVPDNTELAEQLMRFYEETVSDNEN